MPRTSVRIARPEVFRMVTVVSAFPPRIYQITVEVLKGFGSFGF
jgi:hypothetical protein